MPARAPHVTEKGYISLYQFRRSRNDIKSALHHPDKVESSCQQIIGAIFSFLTHSEQSTANSQQSRTVQPESISDISKVRRAHPSIK